MKQASSGKSAIVWIIITVLSVWVGLVVLEYKHSLFFLNDDNASSYIGGYLQACRFLFDTHQLAEINYFQYGGQPSISQAQSGTLYPFTYVACLLADGVNGDPRWLIEWLVAIHLSLGAVGFVLWQIRAGLRPELAWAGALVWIFSPFAIMLMASWVIVSNVICYLPWFFFALDKMLGRPGWASAVFLGLIAGLFFLGGAVQWMSYTAIVAAVYSYFVLRDFNFKYLRQVLLFSLISVAVFLIVSLPLILPVEAAAATSVQRSGPLPLEIALQRSLDPGDFILAQITDFKAREIPTYVPRALRTLPSVLFSSPEVFCLPFLLFLLFRLDSTDRLRRILTPLLLALLALAFSTKMHAVLGLLPVFDRFRWPFKVFIFFKFFLLVAILAAFNEALRTKMGERLKAFPIMLALLLLVAGEGLGTSAFHLEDGVLSESRLGPLTNAFPFIDPNRGRVVSMGLFLGVSTDFDRYLAKNYGTIYQVPQLGGYDPLVGRDQADFGLGLNEENIFYYEITPQVREQLNERAVRYFVIKKEMYEGLDGPGFKDTRILDSDPGRLTLENLRAAPLAMSSSGRELPVEYQGNSLIVHLSGGEDQVGVSLSKTDGWWYRIDHSSWHQPRYDVYRVWCSGTAHGSLLEVRYFNRPFRQGLEISAMLLALLSIIYATSVFRAVANLKEA